MNKSNLENLYSDLLKDRHFNELSLLKKQPNIFSALGIGKHEIRHSNFLAWLLNPNESHGIGDLFLTQFLRDIVLDEKCKEISLIDLPDLNLNKTVIYREWNNIDLVLQIDNIVIAVENKFLSTEHSDQLKRYKKIIEASFVKERKIFVYLTPDGDEASEKDAYINYSYERILEILEELILLHKSSLNNSTILYISDYINAVKLLVMENSPINDLAIKIYNNHKELLDLIFEVKPDSIRLLDNVVRTFVESKGLILGSQAKGYVRFLPKELNEIIPKVQNKGSNKGWPLKESFLFEISNWSEKRMSLKAVVSPGDKKCRDLLSQVLSKVPGSQKPSGEQWLTFYQINIPINYTMLSEKGEETINEILKTEWVEIDKITAKISEAILSRKNDFVELTMEGEV
jgi:hypothetical protein